jgi:integrase
MTQLKDVDGLENAFKSWIENSGGSTGTAKSYWNRIKEFPYFQLSEMDERELSGMLNKELSTSGQKTAVNQFLQFLFEEWERDNVSHSNYEDLRYKKNAVKSNLELPKKEQGKDKDIDVKKHFMHKDKLVELFQEASPGRSKFYYLLYAGGFRIGEIKRLTPAHIMSDYGEYGAVKVTSERSKSDDDRTVEFRSEVPLQILEDSPTGSWEDENGETWNGVFFPDYYSQLERYYLEKWCGALGLAPRTSHSFRHIRLTDLVHASGLELDSIQMRSGHDLGSSVTNNYVEASFDHKPQTLEQYLENTGINILEKIYS